MSLWIQNTPAEKHLVMKAINLMKFEDFENMALVIEWFRTKGKMDSRAKVTSRVLHDAITALEKSSKPIGPTQKPLPENKPENKSVTA